MYNNTKNFLIVTAIVSIFVACGDNSSDSGETTEKVSVVNSVYNLGDCTNNLDGDTVFVRELKSDYLCENGKWSVVDDESDSIRTEKENSSSSEKKDDGPSSTKDAESSSSENKTDDNLEESSSSNEEKVESSSSQSANQFVIKNKTIRGVSQKGPFLKGSKISIYELDGALSQTGKVFSGSLSSDKGEFSVSSINLESQYALLESEGYYNNEVTGKKSLSQIRLRALTDLSNRDEVNVNLLTHLAFDRSLYLVQNSESISVTEAKKQAEKEIFNIFDMLEISSDFEDLNIFNKGDADAVLLAISILMQGKLAEAGLSERLTIFAADVEKDGKWDDEQMKTDIADDVSSMDMKTVRLNIEAWKIGSVIPNFESIVNKFWWDNYGLGDCSADNNGEMKQVSNANSKNYEMYYVCDNSVWRNALAIESAIGACSNKDIGKTAIYSYERNKKQYRFPVLCSDTGWTDINSDQYDTLSLKCLKDGDVVHSDLTDVYYVCKLGKIASLTPGDLDKGTASGDIWDWTKGIQADVGNDNEGLWWAQTDSPDGGNSSFYNSKGNKETSNTEYSFIKSDGIFADKGVFFSYVLGPAYEYAYVETGFRVAADGANILSWKGICIAYSSSVPIELMLVNHDSHDYNYYKVVVPASVETSVANFEWSKFAQDGWGEQITVENALKKVSSIAFREMQTPKEGVIFIKSVGKLGGCSVK